MLSPKRTAEDRAAARARQGPPRKARKARWRTFALGRCQIPSPPSPSPASAQPDRVVWLPPERVGFAPRTVRVRFEFCSYFLENPKVVGVGQNLWFIEETELEEPPLVADLIGPEPKPLVSSRASFAVENQNPIAGRIADLAHGFVLKKDVGEAVVVEIACADRFPARAGIRYHGSAADQAAPFISRI
jgi:hypothetical protein